MATSQIKKLIDFAKANPTTATQEINFGNIPNFQSQDIKAKTDLSVYGAKKVMSNHGIMHALKEHGNDVAETKRGQKGIVDADLELTPKILSEPDDVLKGNLTSRGEQGLVFCKKINGFTYYVVMAIRRKREGDLLYFTTMYIKR